MGGLAVWPLPSQRSSTPQSKEQNQQWPTTKQIGYINPTLGIPQHLKEGGKISGGPQMGGLAR